MSKKVFIMRGIPGAGKSLWIENNLPKEQVFVASADKYFINQKGEYQFDPMKIGDAHNFCLNRFLNNLKNPDIQYLVVDNTNTKVWEIAPYYRIAEVFGFKPEIVWIHCHPQVAFDRCIHNVPSDVIFRMSLQFDPLPQHWFVRHYGL